MFPSHHQQLNLSGNHTCRRCLRYADAITFHATASIYRDSKKQFVITPRSGSREGSGVSIHLESDRNEFSRAELVALVKYTAPSAETYYVAVTQLLKKVPKKQCVVRCEPAESDSDDEGDSRPYQNGDRVNIVSGSMTAEGPSTMQVRKCGSNLRFEIGSDLLLQITTSVPGEHAVMKYCGDYMEYGHTVRKDCSSDAYNVLNEYEAVDPSSGIKEQVCLVPDFGGSDSLRRRRLFWNTNLYSH